MFSDCQVLLDIFLSVCSAYLVYYSKWNCIENHSKHYKRLLLHDISDINTDIKTDDTINIKMDVKIKLYSASRTICIAGTFLQLCYNREFQCTVRRIDFM